MDDLVLIGIVRKVRGNKGDLKVESMSDFPERFDGLKHVYIRRKGLSQVENVEIDKSEYVNNYAVMKLKGVDTFDEAARFVGAEVSVAESERVELPDGTYFIDTLIGMNVESSGGRHIGVVEDVLSNLKQSILLIRMVDGTNFKLPFVSAFVKRVDPDQGKMTVELIEGLLENEGESTAEESL